MNAPLAHLLTFVGAATALWVASAPARAADIYVTNDISSDSSTIGEYTASGATVNASLVTGLNFPFGIAAAGGDLFVANEGIGTIGEYTTSGATVNAALITVPGNAYGIAVSGGNLFTANGEPNMIGEYTTSGATVNASLVTGSNFYPDAIAASGDDLFVYNNGLGAIGEYTTSAPR